MDTSGSSAVVDAAPSEPAECVRARCDNDRCSGDIDSESGGDIDGDSDDRSAEPPTAAPVDGDAARRGS
jgi:hypothetical protein